MTFDHSVGREVGEPPERGHAGGVHQDGDRPERASDGIESCVDRGAIGDVGDVAEVGVGFGDVDGGHVVTVGPQAIGDGPADARRTTRHESCLHAQAS